MTTTRTHRFKPGDRVMFRDGRYGTVERFISAHNGYRVRMDEKRTTFEFESIVIRATGFDLTPADPDKRVEYEAAWPSFTRNARSWTGVS